MSVIHMTCKKSCACSDCEMLNRDTLVIIKQQGLSEKRTVTNCWKCHNYGTYSEELKDLKTSEIRDNFIWI